jgi:AcrR family transcriptional regulator
MPRPFANEERQLLKEKLRQAARRRIEEVGVRAVSVAELARQVGISKGAFYLLYPSKDALVMEILGDVESEMRDHLRQIASDRSGSAVELMTQVVRALFDSVQRHPILALLADPDEGPVIWRMVPPAEMEERMADDDRWFGELASDLRTGGILAADAGDDALAGIARLALTVIRDPDLGRNPGLVDLLCEALGARLAEGER